MFNMNEKVIGNYTKRELRDISSVSLIMPVSDKALINFTHIKNGTTLILNSSSKEMYDEEAYYKYVIVVLNRLKELRGNYTVRIKVNNRELFRRSNIARTLPKNTNLNIDNDDYIYHLDEYLKEEKKLESMVSRIRNANLSPFEKYLAVYDIVKKFKLYQDNDKNPNESRKLKHILNDNNPYIVCAGFSKLLTELLNRVSIPSKYLHVMVDASYEKGMTIEEKLLDHKKHARNLIKIDDKKYNIHGYYLADSTWDNHQNHDLFINSILTFDRKKEAKRLERLDDIDLLLDFHNYNEFKQKISYFFKKSMSYPNIDAKTEEELRKKSYKEIYLKIMDILVTMDNEKYREFYSRYEDLININLSDTTSNKLETPLANFLMDYAKYIIPLSNNNIEYDTIFRAMTEVKKEIDWMNTNEIKEWLEPVIKDNLQVAQKEFPYIYDESYKEGYVEERKR